MKGLKQMVAEASTATETATPALPPVHVSGEAQRELAQNMRRWSGWPDARVILGVPPHGSPYAMCDSQTHTFVVNPDTLVINPNRVLLTVTPFRLRQEAVLTGIMLHEAGHARHSKWRSADRPPVHDDGTEPTEQCVRLAMLMEESRVEGLMTRDAKQIGADTLDWTMRAASAHLLPVTALSADPNQQIMDLISSWALRAGRQYAIDGRMADYRMRGWVAEFTALLHTSLIAHLTDRENEGALDCDPMMDTRAIIALLIRMTTHDDDTGSTMVDDARAVLRLLFPETPDETQDDQPMPSAGCAAQQGESEEGESGEGEGQADESGEGEGNSDPEDEGSGDEPGEGDSGGEGDEPGESESPDAGDDKGEPDEGESEPEAASPSSEEQSALAKALAAMEAQSGSEAADEADEEADKIDDAASGAGAGAGMGATGGWRNPTKEERDIQKGAERFLRDLIDASETSKLSLTDSPSATVNGSALAAWKAGGQVTAPRFFERTHRDATPSPPVKVAILVDISSSMDELQKPSAVLSWALSAAALDLRNFAGRGTQVESCLIHWGNGAYVIQGTGDVLPGIKEHDCDEGTSNMHGAMALVEQQMPGFFDVTERPVHRLIVQFTDWELFNRGGAVVPWMERAIESGVNMLTVAPRDYDRHHSKLNEILKEATDNLRGRPQRGKSTLLQYDRRRPAQVWEQAAQALT